MKALTPRYPEACGLRLLAVKSAHSGAPAAADKIEEAHTFWLEQLFRGFDFTATVCDR